MLKLNGLYNNILAIKLFIKKENSILLKQKDLIIFANILKMKKQFLFYILILISTTSSAQLYQVGGFFGGSNYIGDIGSEYYINPNKIVVGGIAKFNFSPRITFRGTVLYSKIKANDVNAQSNFRKNRGYSFANTLIEGALGIEFSFFKYSLSKIGFTQTPYIIVEVGAVNYTLVSIGGETKRASSLVFPVGVGYKMKLANNLEIALETSFRYTFKDVIDYNNHAIVGNDRYTFGNPKSNDWYVFTGITISYAFGRPGCYTGPF